MDRKFLLEDGCGCQKVNSEGRSFTSEHVSPLLAIYSAAD